MDDPFSFTVPARVPALVLPVGTLKRRQFEQYYSRLRSASEVHLVDVTPTRAAERSLFNPQGYPNGKLMFKLETAPSPDSLFPLQDIEPWRETLAVIGISHFSDKSVDLNATVDRMRDQYGPVAAVHVLVFGVPEAGLVEGTSSIIPILSSNYTSVESAMSDVAGNVLYHLNAFAISKKLGSFKSPSLKALDRPNVTEHDAKPAAPGRTGMLGHPSSNGSDITSSGASPNGSQTGHQNGGSDSHDKRTNRRHLATSSGVVVSRTGSISMGLTERAKSRQRGRSLKFMGNLYLLSGRLPDALHELSEAATILKGSHDHLWFASALESIAVCLVLQAFQEVPITIPSVALSAVGGESESLVQRVSRPGDHLRVFLPALMDTVLRFYGRISPDTEDAVPQTMYHETVLRFCNMLASLRIGGGWSGAALSAVVRGTPLIKTITPESPSLQEIERWCALLLNPLIEEIKSVQAIRLLNGLAAVYSRLDMKRKWAFVVQHLIRILANADIETIGVFPQTLLESLFVNFQDIYPGDKLRVAAVQQFVELAGRMGNVQFIAKASAFLLANGADVLDNTEQRRIYQSIKDSGEVDHPYWDPAILRDIRLPSKASSSSRPIQSQAQPQASQGQSRPDIIYNPFAKREEAEKFSMINGQTTQVHAYLHNPFGFEVHIFEIAVIDVDGNKIGESKNDVFLPAKNIHRLSIGVTPTTDGELAIGGCFIHVSGCPGENFWLRTAPKVSNIVRLKRENAVQKTPRRSVTVDVLPARPTLMLKKTSLQKGWAMLLEGERTKFSLEIANVSSTPSKLLQFGFNDSTVELLKQAMAAPDVTRAEIYEYEHFLHERPAIRMLSPSLPLLVNSSQEYMFELNGKRGVTSATILIDYGSDESPAHRLRVPLSVTVYPSIEVERSEVLALEPGSSFDGGVSADPNASPNVLAVIDMRNAWRQALDVDIWSVDSEGKEGQRVTHRIDSFRTHRFLLPISWPTIAPEQLQKQIPSITNRQYVVDNKTTAEALQTFWLREMLLGRLRGEWRTVAEEHVEPRTGSVEFRGIKLSKRTANVLRTEPLTLRLSVDSDQKLQVGQPLEIVATLHNKTAKVKHGQLRFVPSSVRQLLYTGNLQRPVTIEPGQETTVRLGALPLVHGVVQCSALFDVIGGTQAFQKRSLELQVRPAVSA